MQTTIIVSKDTKATQSYAGGASFEQRMELLSKLNAAAGYHVVPETIVPPGTALIPEGEAKKRALQKEIEALPDAPAAIAAYLERRRLYNPKDVVDSLGNLRMLPGGKLVRIANGKPGPAIGYNHTGLSQLVSFYGDVLDTPRGLTGAIEFLSVAEDPKAPRSPRALAFNDLAERVDARLAEARAQYAAAPESAAPAYLNDRVYRTIVHPVSNERFLRAVTSTKHTLTQGDGPAVVKALTNMLPLGCKLRIIETWDRTAFEFFFPMFRREVLVGDVVMAKVAVDISETKDISASVADGLLRVLCLNFTRAWYGLDNRWSAKHMGAEFGKKLAEQFKGSLERVTPFVKAFGDAYKVAIPGSYDRKDVTARFGKLIQAKPFALPAFTSSMVTAKALEAWDADGVMSAGDTLAGAVNAFTRASQELTIDEAEVVEEAAGRLTVEGWSALGLN